MYILSEKAGKTKKRRKKTKVEKWNRRELPYVVWHIDLTFNSRNLYGLQ